MGIAFNMRLWISIPDIIICLGKILIGKLEADHAGIATQMVVENNLGKKRYNRMTLEERNFLKKFGHGKNILKKKLHHK